jgi:hypothetical protein
MSVVAVMSEARVRELVKDRGFISLFPEFSSLSTIRQAQPLNRSCCPDSPGPSGSGAIRAAAAPSFMTIVKSLSHDRLLKLQAHIGADKLIRL